MYKRKRSLKMRRALIVEQNTQPKTVNEINFNDSSDSIEIIKFNVSAMVMGVIILISEKKYKFTEDVLFACANLACSLSTGEKLNKFLLINSRSSILSSLELLKDMSRLVSEALLSTNVAKTHLTIKDKLIFNETLNESIVSIHTSYLKRTNGG